MIHQDCLVERGRIYRHKTIAGKGKYSNGREEQNPSIASDGVPWDVEIIQRSWEGEIAL